MLTCLRKQGTIYPSPKSSAALRDGHIWRASQRNPPVPLPARCSKVTLACSLGAPSTYSTGLASIPSRTPPTSHPHRHIACLPACLPACPTCRLPEHTTTQWHRPRPPHQRSTTAKMACHCTTLPTAATTAHPLPLPRPVTRLRQRPSAAIGEMSVLTCARIPLSASLVALITDASQSRSHKA